MSIRNTKLNGTDWETGNILSKEDLNDTNNSMYEYAGPLGEVKMFALSTTGAVTKANLQSNGWAVCDGTTPVAQGITSPTITTTPDLQDRFIKMSSDESSGTTGGSNAGHSHIWAITDNHEFWTYGSSGNIYLNNNSGYDYGSYGVGPESYSQTLYTDKQTAQPAFIEMVFFIKVK